MLNVTVRRSQWLRGSNDSKLYRSSDRRMCCLGFACKAAGLSTGDILNKRTPNDIQHHLPKTLEKLADGENTNVCLYLMDINDERDVSAAKRESQLKKLGKTAGLRFKFVGKG